MLAVYQPDVLISDIAMPSEDGYQLIMRVRAQEQASGSARLPAIALSAFSSDEHRHRAAQAGFDAHTGKPFDPDELVKAIHALVR